MEVRTSPRQLGSKPGEFVAQTLVSDFIAVAERKIASVASEPADRSITKSLQRGEDAQIDQLITALGSVSEHCLPSLLRVLFSWHERCLASSLAASNERYAASVEFIFCLVLLDVLKQLPLFPGNDELINHIVALSFRKFRIKDTPVANNQTPALQHCVADLYAEVLGTLAQSRFHAVRNRFMGDLAEFRKDATGSSASSALAQQNIVNLLMGMKFFRVKMVPIEEFEQCVGFLHELARFFLEIRERDRDIKHATAALFVEILLPVAATVKNEVNIPVLKNYVEQLYSHTLDLATKRKHSLAFYPLLTCLLCISQKTFFLSNWHYFLTMCLSNLKHKDSKMSRVAVESLYRLLWVYVIRIKCESNSATHSRLQSIVSSLFPKGGRNLVPRDAPLNIFVKIIHFIGQERLDFAFREVIFDLLSVGRPIRTLYPERMNVGLRALLVIADGLQQREAAPPMPRTNVVFPSGNTLRVRKTFLTRPLNVETARSIGLESYFSPCRRSLLGIIHALDFQVGRQLMITTTANLTKDAEELMGGDRKPKLDLFRTCIAAIPRITPEGMTRQELIELLGRMTLHMDEELRGLSSQTLQNLMVECPEYREDVIYGFLQMIIKEIPDSFAQLLDNALMLLLQLLRSWKNAADLNRPELARPLVLHCVEGLALVMLCQCRAYPRRLAITLMKEVRSLLPLLCGNENHERPALTVLESAVTHVVDRYLPHIPESERAAWREHDFAALCEKVPLLESDSALISEDRGNEYFRWDAWASALSGLLEPQWLLRHCPTALAYAWPAAHGRMTTVFNYVDPNNPQNDSRASLLRSSRSKATSVISGNSALSSSTNDPNNSHNTYLSLWQKYLVFTCAIAPPLSRPAALRSSSPEMHSSAGDLSAADSVASVGSNAVEQRIPRLANVSASTLFKLVVPLLRCELTDMRDSVVLGIGSVSPQAIDCLFDELAGYLREAADKKQENLRRRRRRDLLRLQLIRLLEVATYRGTLSFVEGTTQSGALRSMFVDFLESSRTYLDTEHDRDPKLVQGMRLHFARLCTFLVRSFAVDRRQNLLTNALRYDVFCLLSTWCNSARLKEPKPLNWLERFSAAGLCAMLTCGPVFEAVAISDHDRGYAYNWLRSLLMSRDQELVTVTDEMMVLLLDYNSESQTLLDWLIERCYDSSACVADRCFRAIATVFAAKAYTTDGYPCDHVSMVVLTLMYCGYADAEVQQVAIEFLQLLERRFFFVDSHSADPSVAGSTAGLESAAASESAQSNASFVKSQMRMARRLAECHPELTLPVFSEVSARMSIARPARRNTLAQLLQPWLYNVELIDIGCGAQHDINKPMQQISLSLPAKIVESQAVARRALKGDGWGSAPATELVLSNLLYFTIKFGNENSRQIEKLWAALVKHWPVPNVRVILRYLSVMSSLSGSDGILPYARRVVVYIARIYPERIIGELMNDMELIDTWRCPLERTDVAPFFRWVRRSSDDVEERTDTPGDVIHTKRHSAMYASTTGQPKDEDAISDAGTIQAPSVACTDDLAERHSMIASASMASLVTLKACNDGTLNSAVVSHGMVAGHAANIQKDMEVPNVQHIQAYQLPLPAYGGHYCPLAEILPQTDTPLVVVYRCYLSVALTTDLLLSEVEIDWSIHLPLLLHIASLGLDHSRPLVHESCRLTLIRIILAHCVGRTNSYEIARVLISHNLTPYLGAVTSTSGLGSDITCSQIISSRSTPGESPLRAHSSTSSYTTLTTNSVASGLAYSTPPPKDDFTMGTKDSVVITKDAYSHRFGRLTDAAAAIVDFLAYQGATPTWVWEDITSRNWNIASGHQLSCFISHLVRLLCDLLPNSHIGPRWAQTALHVALSCSSRHYAGRSFQIFRALHSPISSRTLSDILSRLVETVGEIGEDMQGYVTEIMLTLDASVLHVELAEHRVASYVEANSNSGSPVDAPAPQQRSPTHARSTSCSVVAQRNNAAANAVNVPADRLECVEDVETGTGNLPRSKSAQALPAAAEDRDEHIDILAHLLWISVALLESDLEHEYTLALRLLDKLIDLSPQERNECFERLDRLATHLSCSEFNGVLQLLVKGVLFNGCFETALRVITKCVNLLHYHFVDPNGSGFPVLVGALMPYLLLHYDDPTRLCATAANAIAEFAKSYTLEEAGVTAEGHQLDHLATVMKLYSARNFSKDGPHWMRCVVKYLLDTFPHATSAVLHLLTDILERGPAILQQPTLQIAACMFHQVDFSAADIQAASGRCLKSVTRYLQTPFWRDASRILKLAVTRSSFLVAAGGAADGPGSPTDETQQLPGRTLEFNMDLSSLSAQTESAGGDSSPRKQISTSASSSAVSAAATDSWKRGLRANQARVRELLISLLHASGGRVVGLPKSPSVIFSQSSHDVSGMPERHSSTSAASSSSHSIASPSVVGRGDGSGGGTTAGPSGSGSSPSEQHHVSVFREFDFLDGEGDSQSESTDSCFNWLGVLRPRSHSCAAEDDEALEGARKSVGASTEVSRTSTAGAGSGGSVPNLLTTSSLSPGGSRSDESSSSESEVEDEDTSSDSQPVEENDDDIGSLYTAAPVIVSTSNLAEMRPSTPQSLTLSLGSVSELPVGSSLTSLAQLLECVHHSSGQVEEQWRHDVSILDPESYARAMLLFGQLYKDACSKVGSLLRDSCHAMPCIRDVLMHSLDSLMRIADCAPFAFVTTQFINDVAQAANPKAMLLELREHYETFTEKKEHTIHQLNVVKSSNKLRMLGEVVNARSQNQQESDLSRSIHKLFFQLKVLYDSYRTVLRRLQSCAARHEGVHDFSSELTALHKALLTAAADTESPPSSISVAANVSQVLTQLLLQYDGSNNLCIRQSITLMRHSRTAGPPCERALLGCCAEQDVDVLQLLYCRAMADAYPCSIMLVDGEPSMDEQCSVLEQELLNITCAITDTTRL